MSCCFDIHLVPGAIASATDLGEHGASVLVCLPPGARVSSPSLVMFCPTYADAAAIAEAISRAIPKPEGGA